MSWKDRKLVTNKLTSGTGQCATMCAEEVWPRRSWNVCNQWGATSVSAKFLRKPATQSLARKVKTMGKSKTLCWPSKNLVRLLHCPCNSLPTKLPTVSNNKKSVA